MAKTLVMQLARFGDLIQTKRLILSLRQEGETHLALDESLAPLAKVLYPDVLLHPIKAHGGGSMAAGLEKNCKAFSALKTHKFNAVYNLNRNPLNLSVAAMFEPETVYGYRLENGQATASVWAKMAARWTASRRVSPLNLMDFWAYFHPSPIEPAAVNPIARAKNMIGSASRQRIGVALAGREARRSLPPAQLAAVLEALFEARKGPDFFLLGSQSEEAHARLLLKNLSPQTAARVTNLAGKTSLTDICELMQSFDLLVTPDTGLMHLAAHFGVPVMATFLSSAWAWETGPYGMGHLVWQAVQDCSPCLESAPCPHDVACLKAFRSPHWLDHLAGRHSGFWPNGLWGLVSSFDKLGVTYLCVDCGADESPEKDAEERQIRRSLIAEYLGLLHPAGRPGFIPTPATEELLSITDWVLPDYGHKE